MIQMVNLQSFLDQTGKSDLMSAFVRGSCFGAFYPATADRYLDWLFAGQPEIGPNEALLRFLCYGEAQNPELIGDILAWACTENIVEFEFVLDKPTWRRIHHGVTFVPRQPHDLDVRVQAPSGGALSRTALASREQKRRNRESKLLKFDATNYILQGLRSLDEDLEVPSFFVGPDLPPSPTVSQLRVDVPTFLSDMSTWRVVELHWYLRQFLRKRSSYPVSPHELDDFELPYLQNDN